MHLLKILSGGGIVLGLTGLLYAQDVAESDDDVQDQTQAIVVVQKPPLTKIETFEQTPGVVITKGLSRIGNLSTDDSGELNINVVHMKDSTDKKIFGIQVEVAAKDVRPIRCYVDEDEIATVIDALGKLSHVDKNTLPMELIEAGFRTHGSLEILNRDMNGGRMAIFRITTISPLTGQVRVSRVCFRASRLVEIVQQLNNAKGVIDHLKQ